MKFLSVVILVFLSACARDESLRAYGADDDVFALQTLNGQAFNARASVSFPRAWQIVGAGPCNTFSGPQTAPYPWFAPGPLTVTKRSCPQQDQEAAFLSALGRMTVAIVKEFSLTLSNDDGEQMVFSRVAPG